jgi:ABC-type multidrug transport system fused ATPase/permease subunit
MQEDFDGTIIKAREWPERGDIEFRDVKLRYRPKTETVLKELCLDIKGGQKIGIVGRTGAGKSTIALALTRIVEIESGFILIDGHNIQDISLE